MHFSQFSPREGILFYILHVKLLLEPTPKHAPIVEHIHTGGGAPSQTLRSGFPGPDKDQEKERRANRLTNWRIIGRVYQSGLGLDAPFRVGLPFKELS